MILYLGSSSLAKLYAFEPRSDDIRAWVDMAETVATCRIAYTEVISALDIRSRKGDISLPDFERATDAFNRDWEHFVKIDFDEKEAGKFAKEYGLTRFGALHLSSAKLILAEYEKQGIGGAVSGNRQANLNMLFSSTDASLLRAAAAEGLKVLPLT